MRQQTRTGAGYMGPSPVDFPYSGNGNGGGCSAQLPAQPQSWGSACPSGTCTSADLAASLGRAFGGERYGCREIGYWLSGTSSAGGALTLTQNALITICPTRIIAAASGGQAIGTGALLTVFTVGSQNQIFGDPLPLAVIAPDSVQMVPFVSDCIKSGTPFTLTFTGLTATTLYSIGLIGPAIG